VHNELTEDIFENQQKLHTNLKDPKAQNILEQAEKNWVEYTPKNIETKIAGVDSSQNQVKFQGHSFWAVKANAIGINSEIIKQEFEWGNASQAKIGKIFDSIPPKLEYRVARNASSKSDFVLIDGSLSSRFYMRQQKIPGKSEDEIIKTIKECKNILYISKNSTSNEEFKAEIADIAYYDHATHSAGFSKLRIDDRFYRPEKGWGIDKISYTFVRMPGTLGCFKLELYGTGYTHEDIKKIMDKISFNCVKGYPYVLKQAHNNCVITSKYMKRMHKMAGMNGEFGAREILNG